MPSTATERRFQPLYHADRLTTVNPHGDVGLITPFASPVPVVVEELPDGGDDRGTGGFGSSGR